MRLIAGVQGAIKTTKQREAWMNLNTQERERDSKSVQEWSCIFEKSLQDLLYATHTNKMHILFGSPSHKNYKVKHVWPEEIVGWKTP